MLGLSTGCLAGERTDSAGRIDGRDRVFDVPTHILRRLYDDMTFAGVVRKDDRGRARDFHALRHTAARRLILAGASPKYVQRFLRHTDIRMTFDLYADLDVDELLDAAPVVIPPIKEADHG